MSRVLMMLLVVLCTNCDERAVNKEGSPVIIGSGGRILMEVSVAAAAASPTTMEVNIASIATAENSAKSDEDEEGGSVELERQREETRERITDSVELRRVKPLRCAMLRLNYLDGGEIYYDVSRHVTVGFKIDNAVYPVVEEDDLMAKILVARSTSIAMWDYVYVWKMDLTVDPTQTHAYRDFIADCDGGTELHIPSEVPTLCPEKFAKAPPEQ